MHRYFIHMVILRVAALGETPPLKNVGHSLRSSGRNVESLSMKGKVVASSRWIYWYFERTELDKQFGWREI